MLNQKKSHQQREETGSDNPIRKQRFNRTPQNGFYEFTIKKYAIKHYIPKQIVKKNKKGNTETTHCGSLVSSSKIHVDPQTDLSLEQPIPCVIDNAYESLLRPVVDDLFEERKKTEHHYLTMEYSDPFNDNDLLAITDENNILLFHSVTSNIDPDFNQHSQVEHDRSTFKRK